MAAIVPITSDAGLRYWPFATAGLIVVNIAAFFFQFQLEEPEDYALWHGEGLHPIQWVTSMFMHGDLAHLLGNMIFLWIFGHIVEGIVGWFKFCVFYLGLGILQCLIEQLLFYNFETGPSLGASSAIYAIMLIAAWLAPHANIQCLAFFFYRFFFFDVPVLMMAGIYFILDFMHSAVTGFEMSTPWLHAMGGLLGLIAGFWALQSGWVDNDGDDLLTYWRTKPGESAEPSKPRARALTPEEQARAEAERVQQWETSEKSFRMHLQAGNVDGVLSQYQQLRRLRPEYQWKEEDLLQVIRLVLEQKKWQTLDRMSEAYLERFQSRAVAVRLNWAKAMLEQQDRPSQALRILRPLSEQPLTPSQQQLAKQLIAECQRKRDEGTLEVGE